MFSYINRYSRMCSIYSRDYKHISIIISLFLCRNLNRRDKLIRIMCFFFCTTDCTTTTYGIDLLFLVTDLLISSLSYSTLIFNLIFYQSQNNMWVMSDLIFFCTTASNLILDGSYVNIQ